jgi:hypothetical protein
MGSGADGQHWVNHDTEWQHLGAFTDFGMSIYANQGDKLPAASTSSHPSWPLYYNKIKSLLLILSLLLTMLT